MKIIFISVPMADRTDEDIQKDIEEAKERYAMSHEETGETYCYLDNRTFILPDYATRNLNPDLIPLAYLGHALETMAGCDDVIFAGDWRKARGCLVERLVYDLYFPDN